MSDSNSKSTVEVILRIFGDNLDVDEMSRVLGVSPSVSHRKGDDLTRGKHSVVGARTSSWSLEYCDYYKYGKIEERIDQIVQILSSSKSDFREVSGYERSIINCIICSENTSIECSITPKVMKRLSDLEVGIELTSV